MTTQDIYTYFQTLTLRQQADIIGNLRDMRSQKFNEMYVTVAVYNGAANISHLIQKITGFNCWHEPSSIGGVGTNVVCIDRELYTPELSAALIEYFSGEHSTFSHEGWNTKVETVINS